MIAKTFSTIFVYFVHLVNKYEQGCLYQVASSLHNVHTINSMLYIHFKLKLTFITPLFVKCISRIADIKSPELADIEKLPGSVVSSDISISLLVSTGHASPFRVQSQVFSLHTHLLYSIVSPSEQKCAHNERLLLPFEHVQLVSSALQAVETGIIFA